MSDTENNAAVAVEEAMDISQEPVTSNGDHGENEDIVNDDGGKGDVPEKIIKKDVKISGNAVGSPMKESEDKGEPAKVDDQVDSSPPKKKKAEEKKPKDEKSTKDVKKASNEKPKVAKVKEDKAKEESKDEEEEKSDDEEEEEEDVKVALLEQSPVLESGQKRQRKKVERMEYKSTETEKPKLEITEGKGTKLGDIPRVEFQIGRTLAEELKRLHKLLYGKLAPSSNKIKKNIREFSGFSFDKDSTEYDKKKLSLSKMTMTVIKSLCTVVDLERSGQKDVVITRLMDFLLEPTSSGKSLPKKRKRSSSVKRKSKSKKASGGKEKKKKKAVKSKSKDKVEEESGKEDDEDEDASGSEEENEDQEDASDGDEEEGEEAAGSDEESTEEKEEDEEESDYEEAPKKKRARKDSPKKAPAKQKKELKKTPQKEAKKTPKPKKETKKATPKKSAEKKPAKRRIVDSSDDDSSDDEPLIAKKKPPTDEELRDVIKKILDTANLEEVTMKTVCRKVYDKYPDFDLTSKKDFIKTTVKQIIR